MSNDLKENARHLTWRFSELCVDKCISPSTESFVLDRGLNPAELEHCRKAPSFYTCWLFMREARCGRSLGAAMRKPDICLDVQGFECPQDLQEDGQCVRESLAAAE